MKQLKYNYNPNDFKLFPFACFSTANLIDNFYYINASIQIIIFQDLLKMDFKKVHYKLAELKGRSVVIYNILNVNEFYLNRKYYGDSDEPIISSTNKCFKKPFFSEEWLNRIRLDLQSDTLIFFHFEDIRWREILYEFKQYNIVIIVSSSVKIYLLRITEFKLVIWLMVLDGMSFNKTISSFKLEPQKCYKIRNDFTSKKIDKFKKKKIKPPPRSSTR
jgi:hypothetical protein